MFSKRFVRIGEKDPSGFEREIELNSVEGERKRKEIKSKKRI